MATVIGIELGIAFDILHGFEPAFDARHNRAKLLLHLHTVIAFLAGGIGGVLPYLAVGALLLIIAAALLILIAVRGLSASSKQKSPHIAGMTQDQSK